MSKPNIEAICRALDRKYGSPRHGNKDNPLDELLYIILSTRTRESAYQQAFQDLKQAFPDWNSLTPDKESALATILHPYGLGSLKASHIIRIIGQIRSDFGTATLDPLKEMTDAECEEYLTNLPGIGLKVAKCVLLYALNRTVLPVDVHTYRIAARIGYHVKRRADTSQDMIESAIPPNLRYGFHVNAISLGRDVCLPKNPRCDECCINRWCDYFKRHHPYHDTKGR